MDQTKSVLPSDSRTARLPPELWIEVLSRITPGPRKGERTHVVARLDNPQRKTLGEEVLRNVSLTCWRLHDLALPIRFRRVDLHVQVTKRYQPGPTELFARLSASQKLRDLVKYVGLWVYDHDEALPPLPELAQIVLCGMHKLEDLVMMTSYRMTTPVYSHICSLRSLRRLKVTIPHSYPSPTPSIVTAESNQSKIQSLMVTYSISPAIEYGMHFLRGLPYAPWASLPSWLMDIALSDSICDMRLMNGIIIPSAGFPDRHMTKHSSHLTTLQVTVPYTKEETDDLVEFLRHAPLITTLILDHEGRDVAINATAAEFTFPSDLVPALRHFEGSLKYATSIVPGRPVEEIVLDPPKWKGSVEYSLDDLLPLRLSTSVIRLLELRRVDPMDCFALVAALLPDLEELRLPTTVKIDNQDWLQRGFVADINKLVRLQTLTMHILGGENATQEKDALLQLPQNHPLEKVQFSRCDSFGWGCDCSRRLWTRVDGTWVQFRSAPLARLHEGPGLSHSQFIQSIE